jgi:6-phosphogluconolactonase
MVHRKLYLIAVLIGPAVLASATTPVVTVTSPGNGSSVGSPVNYVASASSPSCAGGISAMRIYTAPGVNAYTIHANSLNANLNLSTGGYNTVVQAWDNCGGVGKQTVNITVAKINLPPPKFLYATEYKAGRIAEYVVNPLTGSLTPTSQGSAWAHWGPVDIASDPGGYRLYVANSGSHDLDAYFIYRNTGNLYQVPGSPFPLTGLGNRVVVHSSGHFVYATSTNSSSSTDISAFAVQSNGSLTPVPGSPFAEGSGTTGALAMHPSGKYLYAAVGLPGNVGAVAVYAINQVNGALTPIGSPFPVPAYAGCTQFCNAEPGDLQVDASGNYLYGVQSPQDSIAGFRIDPTTGTLTDLPGSPYPDGSFNTGNTPKDPWRLSINPNGTFIYTADDEGDSLSLWAVNKATGVPTFQASVQPCTDPNVPGIFVPDTVAVDPSGSFVYTQGGQTNGCNIPPGATGAMAGFSINQGNGYLFSVPGNPFVNSNLHTSDITEESVVVTK